MKFNVEMFCNDCKKDFSVSELKTKTVDLKKRGKVAVQYFNCPHCGKEYVVCIYDERMNKLTRKKQALSERKKRMSDAVFQAKHEALKTQINAEESMLLHIYMRQYGTQIHLL